MTRALDKIIDWERPYKMIFSGVENEEYFNILYNMGIRDFLMSYEYLKSKKDLQIYKDKGIKFFIDSGAYTYMGKEEYYEKPIEYWENQIEEYLKWSEEHKEMIFAIANLDLEYLVGTEKVVEWNKKYFEPFMLKTGIPVCFIWHPISGESHWESYCQRYPYVGFSWVSDNKGTVADINFGAKMLRVAEKYNSVVHGMGMTRTSYLTKLPFYTSDSTTWLVGLQYGEINYWTGNKMTRLKKEKWKGEYLPKLLTLGLNKEKLLAEDTEEMIKANIKAFQLAIEYIDTKLLSRMYWLKSKPKENDLDDISIFPPLEWIEGKTNYENWEEYAKRLNISTVDRTFAVNSVIDATVFCNIEVVEGKYMSKYPEILKFFKERYLDTEVYKEIYDLLINQVNDKEEDMVSELVTLFRDTVEGKDEKLLHWGTNFDRIAKERESYIEEEEYELKDMSEEEVRNRLAHILPAPKQEGDPHPEVTELDDEIFKKVDIIPVRDEKGRFLKGQKVVRKPKNIYSKKYPKLVCDTCYAAQTCPEFKAGYVCAYDKMFDRFDTRNVEDIIDAMQSMVNLNLSRMQRVALFEMLDGGMPDGNLTGMIDQNMRLLQNLQKMYLYAPEVLKQTRIMRADGTEETTLEYNNPSGGGILEKLFANVGDGNKKDNSKKEDKKEDDNQDIIEVELDD